MPFIVGIHSSNVSEIQQLPLDEVLLVNLDTWQVKASPTISQEIKQIPSRYVVKAKQDLTNILTAAKSLYIILFYFLSSCMS
jgi:hypothetical protein